MKRLLIANRGEIAIRIIRSCREMGISPVAVYSEADRNLPYVSQADAAYLIGPAPAAESYLNIPRILAAAKQAAADAVHPGYGFLSENPDFSLACADSGLTFVGPPANVMRALGDKIEAKKRMLAGGVPIVPGYFGDDQSVKKLSNEAKSIGFPLLVKAAAGGGGRGMRLVERLEQLTDSLDEARREAESAFGDGRVMLERYLENPRHIEVQILGDVRGNVVHLYERECSIQRRHQKIVEESPSPALTPELRGSITVAAVRAGKAVGYVNAGTVEFLLEERPAGGSRFYFMEVNTRLQVEHPVTEMRTDNDLVKLQLRIAGGEKLPLRQEQVRPTGHAIEVRIYAEDPQSGFLPSIGMLHHWIEPNGPGIRIDSGVERGCDVSPYYDPLLAKLIAYGEDRLEAISRIEQALMRFVVLGVKTNIPYLLDIIRHPEFQAGRTHTGFLKQHFEPWQTGKDIPEEVLLALAAESLTRSEGRRGIAGAACPGAAQDPWMQASGWRNTD